MKKIYLITHLYNFDDKIRTCQLEEYLKNNFDVSIYMPYRDTKEELIDSNIWKQEIFKQDIKAIEEADVILGYIDGLEFDEGIGFEIGYALSKNKQIILLNSDFIKYNYANYDYDIIDPILDFFNINILKISHHLDFDNFCDDLVYKKNELLKLITKNMINKQDIHHILDKKVIQQEFFIETGNSKYFYNLLQNKNVSKRLVNFNAQEDIKNLLYSKKMFVFANGMQMHFGSAILCGICFGLDIPFYIVDDKMIYITGKDIMKTNLMIDQASQGYINIGDFVEKYI